MGLLPIIRRKRGRAFQILRMFETETCAIPEKAPAYGSWQVRSERLQWAQSRPSILHASPNRENVDQPHLSVQSAARRHRCCKTDCKTLDRGAAKSLNCGCSSMVEQKPSKLMTRVRFPSPAPNQDLPGAGFDLERRSAATGDLPPAGGSFCFEAHRAPERGRPSARSSSPSAHPPPVDSIAAERHWPRPIVRTMIGVRGNSLPPPIGPSPPGEVAEWLKAADCKSARASVRWFESSPLHQPRNQVSPFRWQLHPIIVEQIRFPPRYP